MTFDKADVVGRINLFCHLIVASISLSIEVIADQDTLKGAVINLGIVALRMRTNTWQPISHKWL